MRLALRVWCVTLLGVLGVGYGATDSAHLLENSSEPGQRPVSIGATVVSADWSTVVLRAGGPAGPGKLGGSTLSTRVTARTRFGCGLRRGQAIGTTVPVAVTIDMRPDRAGSYRLIAIDPNIRARWCG